MRCKKEEFIKGEYFHLYNRSVENTLLFKSDDDYLYFLDKLKPKIITYPASVFAYYLPRVIKCIITYVGNNNQNDLSLVYVFMKI